MPHIAMRRADIPGQSLQVTDLKPNNSQRNNVYEPEGETRYIAAVHAPGALSIVTGGGGELRTSGAASGLAAYFLDRVEDQTAGAALTAPFAQDAADLVVARVVAGTKVEAADVAADLVTAGAGAGTSLTAGTSTGTLADVLNILAGQTYTVPGGVQVETAGGAFDATISGSFTDSSRQVIETGAFNVSNGAGQLFGFQRADFTYLDVAGPAVVVYADDGTLL